MLVLAKGASPRSLTPASGHHPEASADPAGPGPAGMRELQLWSPVSWKLGKGNTLNCFGSFFFFLRLLEGSHFKLTKAWHTHPWASLPLSGPREPPAGPHRHPERRTTAIPPAWPQRTDVSAAAASGLPSGNGVDHPLEEEQMA